MYGEMTTFPLEKVKVVPPKMLKSSNDPEDLSLEHENRITMPNHSASNILRRLLKIIPPDRTIYDGPIRRLIFLHPNGSKLRGLPYSHPSLSVVESRGAGPGTENVERES